MTDLQLETALTDAADRLLQIDPADREGWIIFFLETLGDSAVLDTYETMLIHVAYGCLTRVANGSW